MDIMIKKGFKYLDYFVVSKDIAAANSFTYQCPMLNQNSNGKQMFLLLSNVSHRVTAASTIVTMANVSCQQIGRGDTLVSLPYSALVDIFSFNPNLLVKVNNLSGTLTFDIKSSAINSTLTYTGSISLAFSLWYLDD
jgi:hypothetical protein